METPSGEPSAQLLPTYPLSRDLFDDTVLWAWEQQLRIEDVLGGDSPYGKGPWWVDPQAGTISFNHGGQPSLLAAAQFLGSASPAAGLWVWGWADPSGFPEPVVDASARLRVHAESYEHHGLHAPTLPLVGDTWEVVRRIGFYASYVFDLPCYTFDGGGIAGAVLMEHPLFALREPTSFRTAPNGQPHARHGSRRRLGPGVRLLRGKTRRGAGAICGRVRAASAKRRLGRRRAGQQGPGGPRRPPARLTARPALYCRMPLQADLQKPPAACGKLRSGIGSAGVPGRRPGTGAFSSSRR